MRERGTALVTGATGFVGSAVVRALLSAGYRVRALCRTTSVRANLVGLDVEIAYGDICDADAVTVAMSGARFVVHAAADYRLWARDPDAITRTNVTGTHTVMLAALRARVERIVHTSSVATLALRRHGETADETTPLAESAAVGAYKRSKIVAERYVESMIGRDGLPAVIVNPSTPIGPRDIRPTPTGRIIVQAATGRMPAFVDSGLNLVHVDDVGRGHVSALEQGRIGERYILGGENVPLERMLGDIALLVGRKPPRLSLPRGPLYPLAYAAQTIAKMTGREPFLTVDGLRMSEHHMFFSSAKAKRELDYRARPYIEGLRDAIDWFRAAGYLSS
jgi:dihydroflavonol-4-reductase